MYTHAHTRECETDRDSTLTHAHTVSRGIEHRARPVVQDIRSMRLCAVSRARYDLLDNHLCDRGLPAELKHINERSTRQQP